MVLRHRSTSSSTAVKSPQAQRRGVFQPLLQPGMDGRGARLLQQAAHPGTAIPLRERVVQRCGSFDPGGTVVVHQGASFSKGGGSPMDCRQPCPAWLPACHCGYTAPSAGPGAVLPGDRLAIWGRWPGRTNLGPHIMGKVSTISSTYRARGPSWVKASTAPNPHGTICPVRGTRPEVGLIPAIPLKWAGTRILPRVSLPISSGDSARRNNRRGATATAPRGAGQVIGIVGAPVNQVIVLPSRVSSGVLVLPSRIAPAARRRATTVAS